jgi:hypothetical protein
MRLAVRVQGEDTALRAASVPAAVVFVEQGAFRLLAAVLPLHARRALLARTA